MSAVSATDNKSGSAETFADYDECEEFIMPSSNTAMDTYEKTAKAVGDQIRLMAMKQRLFAQHKFTGETAFAEINGCRELLTKTEQTLKDVTHLFGEIHAAIAVCPQPPIHGSEDAQKLQKKIDHLQSTSGDNLQIHATTLTNFTSALADTTYYFLNSKNQTTTVQYLTWKFRPSSWIFAQYDDFIRSEKYKALAVAPGMDGAGSPGGSNAKHKSKTNSTATAATAVVDGASKQPETPAAPSVAVTAATNAKTSETAATPSESSAATAVTASAKTETVTPSTAPPTATDSASISKPAVPPPHSTTATAALQSLKNLMDV